MDIFNTVYRGKTIPIAAPSPLMAVTTRLKIEGDLAKYWSLINASPEDKLPTGEKVRRFKVEGYLQEAPRGTKPIYQSDQSPRGYSRIEDTVSITERAREANQQPRDLKLSPEREARLDEMARGLDDLWNKTPVSDRPYTDPKRVAARNRYFLSQAKDEIKEMDMEADVKLNGLKGIDIGKPVYRDQVDSSREGSQPKTEEPKKAPNITQRKKLAQHDTNQPNLLDLTG